MDRRGRFVADAPQVRQAPRFSFTLPVISIANLDSLLAYLADSGHQELARWRPAVQQYRDTYGV